MSNVTITEHQKTDKQKKIEEDNKKLEKLLMSDMNPDVLAKLKEKNNDKEDVAPIANNFAINLAVVGVGQAGSRIAEVMNKKGYSAGVINTSSQDLEFIKMPDDQKLLLEGTLGGTGKDLDLGREIFEENEEKCYSFINKTLGDNDMLYLAMSGGGGTGSSCPDTIIPLMVQTGAPVGVIYILPKDSEDAQSKSNSIQTLSRLAKMSTQNMISNLVVVDNAKIEQIYADLSQAKFWEAANEAIVEPLDVFNTLTATASRHTSLDPSDFAKVISCGDCSIYGVVEVENYMEETALAEAVIDSLNQSMLAEGFDLKQTRVGGVIITGTKKVMDQLPALNINYCYSMISEKTNGANIFQGVYDVHTKSDSVKIYTWFAGLGLPKTRIDVLKEQAKALEAVAKEKEDSRKSAMSMDLGKDSTTSLSDEINRKIKKKKSGFNRLQRGSMIDARRKR
jgi:cell division GTPase FtsZ